MNIALIGFRGTGKTTTAKLLARKMDKKLISTDEEIEKKIKTTISKFVKKYGWEKFRDVEGEVIDKVSELDECVFDTGGGIILRNENVINLKKSSLVVLLTSDAKTITNRLKNSKQRPALKGINYIDEVKDVLREREHLYKNAADYSIDTSSLSPEEVCDLIMHYIQMEMQ